MKLTKAFSADIEVNEGERAVTAKISTIACDREGDVLIPAGCNSKDFEKNPIVFLNHEYWGAPKNIMGQCVAIKRTDDAIIAKTVFASRPPSLPESEEWLPDTIFDLYKQKVIRGFSVGFDPIEKREANNRDIEKFGASCRRVFSKWALYEYSVAPLMMNQEALAMAVSKGIIKADMAKKVWEYEATAEPDPNAETVIGKTVVLTLPAPEPQVEPVKAARLVHRIITMKTPDPQDAKLRKFVMAEVAKDRGQLYAD